MEAPHLHQALALAQELSLDFVEINSNLPLYHTQSLDIDKTRSLLERFGISLTLHTEEFLHLTDLNPVIRRFNLDLLLSEIAVAKEIGIPLLNLHLLNGVENTLPSRVVILFDAYREQFLQGVIELRDRCTEAVGDTGMILSIENLNGYCAAVQDAIDLLLQSPVFALTWDIGHDHCAANVDAPQWLRHTKRVKHLHLHDAKGKKPHLPLGEGELDLQSWFDFATEQGSSVVLEVKDEPGLRKSMDYIREHITL